MWEKFTLAIRISESNKLSTKNTVEKNPKEEMPAAKPAFLLTPPTGEGTCLLRYCIAQIDAGTAGRKTGNWRTVGSQMGKRSGNA